MKLDDMRTPTCPNCGGAKLETDDVIDTSVDTSDGFYSELVIGTCPNCNCQYEYTQFYSIKPTHFDMIECLTEEEICEDE